MLEQINHLILDMDGVLWHGETPMPGLTDFFDTLDACAIGYVMATNNATKTAEQYVDKFRRFGVNVDAQRILTSAETTAAHLSRQFAPGTAVYIVGDKGLHMAMQAHEFQIVAPAEVRSGARPPLVVLGFTPNFTYDDLAMGALVLNSGAEFVGTNPDPSIPSELGHMPGAGAMLALLSAATRREPTIVGKPGPLMFEHALKRLGGHTADTAMVGDRMLTDVAGAKQAGLWAILLLSGSTRSDEIPHHPHQPDLVFNDISDLARALQRAAELQPDAQ